MGSLDLALDAPSAVDLGADAAVRVDADHVSVGSPAATGRRDHPLRPNPGGHHAKKGDAREDDGADHESTNDRFPYRCTDFEADHSPKNHLARIRGPHDNWSPTDRNRHHACPDDNLIDAEPARHTAYGM